MVEYIVKSKDEEKRYIFGYASVSIDASGQLVVDAEGDSIDPDDLQAGAYEFMIASQVVGEEHQRMDLGKIIESFFYDADKLEVMGLVPDATTHQAAWWVGLYIEDQKLWDSIKSGDKLSFSIGGEATRVND